MALCTLLALLPLASASGGDYQQYVSSYAGDYQKYLAGGSDYQKYYQKYMDQYGAQGKSSGYKKYFQKYMGSGSGGYEQYMSDYAGKYVGQTQSESDGKSDSKEPLTLVAAASNKGEHDDSKETNGGDYQKYMKGQGGDYQKYMIGSKIELGRIVLYVFFPVAIFFYFNMPGSYEDFMTQKKKELYPPDEECNKPPNTTEGLAKAWEKILKEKKDKTQN